MNRIDLSGNATLPLKPENIKLIEETHLLGIGEKMELILVSLGVKLTTEVSEKIPYSLNSKEQKETPKKEYIEKIEHLLQKLPFPYYLDHLEKKKRANKTKKELHWFQVCLNPRVKYFMEKYADELTEMEDGILYGYPISAIRAFSGLIDPNYNHSSSEEHIFAGVGSKAFKKRELQLYREWWKKIQEISPQIARQAEKNYQDYSPTDTHPLEP